MQLHNECFKKGRGSMSLGCLYCSESFLRALGQVVAVFPKLVTWLQALHMLYSNKQPLTESINLCAQ